mgnify:CR=1 FL=1
MGLEEKVRRTNRKINVHIEEAAKITLTGGTLNDVIKESKQAINLAIEMEQEIYDLS